VIGSGIVTGAGGWAVGVVVAGGATGVLVGVVAVVGVTGVLVDVLVGGTPVFVGVLVGGAVGCGVSVRAAGVTPGCAKTPAPNVGAITVSMATSTALAKIR
jgi:hypothetical protein